MEQSACEEVQVGSHVVKRFSGFMELGASLPRSQDSATGRTISPEPYEFNPETSIVNIH
jgi:hypothetical protein